MKISFFDPIINISPDKTFESGKFGEWFFNVGCRKVYQIRTDALKSKEGIEVMEKDNIQTKMDIVLRVVLAITVLPLVLAFSDKLYFRLTHSDLHVNPLPDQWRQDRPGFVLGKKQINNGFSFGEPYLPDGKDYTGNSAFVYMDQAKPWLDPNLIHIIEVDQKNNAQLSSINGFWNSREKKAVIIEYNGETFDSPEEILKRYQEKNPGIKAAEKTEDPVDNSKISKLNIYKGIFLNFTEFYQHNPSDEDQIFYNLSSKNYFLTLSGTALVLDYQDGHYITTFGNRQFKEKEFNDLLKIIKQRIFSVELE